MDIQPPDVDVILFHHDLRRALRDGAPPQLYPGASVRSR